MTLTTAIAIYFVIWWIVLFAVLPFGVRSQHEDGAVVPGTEPGAPSAPRLLAKLFWTSVVAALVFAALWGIRQAGFGLDDVPFGPVPRR